MDEILLSDLSVLNIEKEFSEKFDFNSVVDNFAKMKNRLNRVSVVGLCVMYGQLHVSMQCAYMHNCCNIKYVIINVYKIYF